MLNFLTVLRLLSVAMWLVASAGANAVAVQGSKRVDISSGFTFAEDQSGSLDIERVSRSPGLFQKTGSGAGLPTRSVFWARVELERPVTGDGGGYLVMDPTLIGRIDVFSVRADGSFRVSTVDDLHTVGQRSTRIRALVFELEPPTDPLQVVFVRFEPRGKPLQSKMYWVSDEAMPREVSDAQLMQGLLFGALLALVAYNVFLWYATRDASYGLYVYYLASFCILMALLTGTRPSWMAGAGVGGLVFWNCAVIHGGLTFFNYFLDLRKHCLALARAFRALQWITVGLALSTFAGVTTASASLSLLLIGIAETALIVASVARWRQGFEPAKFSVYGLAVHASISTLFVAQLVDLLSISGLSIYALEVAAVWEGLFFSFALAYRLRLAEAAASRLIKEQADALEREQAALAAAREATKEKNLVLSMISHELRSPLQALIAALDVEKAKHREGGHAAFIRKVEHAAARIGSQLRDLFILSVGEAGHLEMRAEAFEVAELVNGVVEGVVDQFDAKGLSVQVSGPSPLFVIADPTRVEQVLSNLVENAFKYTDHGGVDVKFDLRGATLVFSVTDTGRGISSTHQKALFEPFRRFASVERDRASSGIGLAVVKLLATHLGGTVSFVSELGQGSTFTVEIPVTLCEEPPAESNEEPRTNLLIVDDRADVLDALCALACSLDYECDAASNAAVASNQMAARVYDAVLIDLDMPVKSGYELASEIRRGNGLNAQAFLVAISAGTAETGEVIPNADGSLWPFDAFLQKPIDGQTLKRLVEHGPR